jgi:hypothetical protein
MKGDKIVCKKPNQKKTQAHENRCVGLNGEFVKLFYAYR